MRPPARTFTLPPPARPGLSDDPQWYSTAVFYQVLLRAGAQAARVAGDGDDAEHSGHQGASDTAGAMGLPHGPPGQTTLTLGSGDFFWLQVGPPARVVSPASRVAAGQGAAHQAPAGRSRARQAVRR